MTEILRSIEGNLLGLDKDDNLLVKGSKIILNHLVTEHEIAVNTGTTVASSRALTAAVGATTS